MKSKSTSAVPASIATLLVILGGLVGCTPESTEVTSDGGEKKGPAVSEVPLRVKLVATVDDLESIKRTWLAKSSQPIDAEVLTTEELLGSDEIKADVIVYPARLLCELAERGWINRLPSVLVEKKESLSVADTLQAQCKVGEQTFAVPLGCSVPVFLLSDSVDISEDTDAQWSALLGQIPQEKAIEIDAQQVDHDALVDRYLAILATQLERNPKFGTLFDLKSLRPLLDQPAYVRAAEILVQVAHQTTDGSLALASDDVVWKTVQTADAPVLSVASPLSQSSDVKRAKGGKILARPPVGKMDVNETSLRSWNLGSGLIASISSNCRQSSQARAFVTWLREEETRNQLAPHIRGVSVTSPVFGIESLSWQAQVSSGSVVRATNVPFEPRLPAAQSYRDSLAEHLLDIVSKKVSPKEGLLQAVADWEEISAKNPDQQFAYEKSLGLVF